MYLGKQDARELHDEVDDPAEEALRKPSGATACQPSLWQKLTQVPSDSEAHTPGLDISLRQKGRLRPVGISTAGGWGSHQAQLCLSNPLLTNN